MFCTHRRPTLYPLVLLDDRRGNAASGGSAPADNRLKIKPVLVTAKAVSKGLLSYKLAMEDALDGWAI